eukprot:GHRQ01032612.1.p1 GENE.GHRQ01032612.1~~GHRQ01032612.1.p1  ORF type:complete len:151 (+),score=16.51 GHRQ01032612.1:107-559(+)
MRQKSPACCRRLSVQGQSRFHGNIPSTSPWYPFRPSGAACWCALSTKHAAQDCWHSDNVPSASTPHSPMRPMLPAIIISMEMPSVSTRRGFSTTSTVPLNTVLLKKLGLPTSSYTRCTATLKSRVGTCGAILNLYSRDTSWPAGSSLKYT